ncbi:hypothetical protein V8C34DRAFT_323874 [Trichoderma compactum]
MLSREFLDMHSNTKSNPPYIRPLDTWGCRVDDVGLTVVPESRLPGHGRVVQFAKCILLFSSLSGGWGSQLALTQISSDPSKAWTSRIWVTELPSGSDFTGLTTADLQVDDDENRVGELKLGRWALYGSKVYASGPDATVTLVLANTAKWPSAFLAPRRIPVQDERGRAVHLIGQEGRGAREVFTFLTVARMFACAGTLSAWGHSLRVARAFAKVLRVGGRPLNELSLHMHSLSESHMAYKARLMLLLYLSSLLQLNDQRGSGDETLPFCVGLGTSAEDMKLLFRWLVPAAKAIICREAVYNIGLCMEFLGGVGYMENEEGEFNIARLYRDMSAATLTAIDTAVFPHLKSHQSLALERKLILESWSRLKLVLSESSIEHIRTAESFVRHVVDLICAALLIADAGRDDDELACEFAKRWVLQVCGAAEHHYKKVEVSGELLLGQKLRYGNAYQG